MSPRFSTTTNEDAEAKLIREWQELPDDIYQWPADKVLIALEAMRRKVNAVPVENFFGKELHEAQQQMLKEARRYNVADCGRRFGKSVLGGYLDTETLLQGQPCAWMAPSNKSLSESWRDLKLSLAPITTDKSEQEHRLQVNTGGILECWSLDNPDAPRGRHYKRVIVDEAAQVRNLGETWQAVIQPTLLDLRGDAWFLSTPKGGNFFRTLYTWGQDGERYPEWKSWQFPTTANTAIDRRHYPGYLAEEIERLRLNLPDRWFRQEYLAEFIDDAGGVFRRVQESATLDTAGDDFPVYAAGLEIQADHKYVIGVDWGKLHDFTVLAVIDATAKQLVALDRFNQIDYELQIKRLKSLALKFGTRSLIPERNSMGDPLIEQLKRDDYQVHPFTTTNASKAEAIDALTLAFEKQELAILNLPILIDELQAYEAERLPSGMLRYSAPEGYHDDCVMALALAWHGASERPAQVDESFSFSYVGSY